MFRVIVYSLIIGNENFHTGKGYLRKTVVVMKDLVFLTVDSVFMLISMAQTHKTSLVESGKCIYVDVYGSNPPELALSKHWLSNCIYIYD